MSINPDNITTIRVDQLAEATLNLTNEFPHSSDATLRKATIQSLVDLVATAVGSGSGVGFLPISVTDGQQLPDIPTDPSFFLCGPGTYLNINGYPNIVCTDELNAVMSLTDHWQLSVGIPITTDLQSIGISQSVNYGVLDKAPSENAVYNAISASSTSVPDATNSVKGIVKLAGDLAGKSDLPTVPNKQNYTIARTGSTITFDTPAIYNSPSSPSVSNLLDDLTGARIGIIQPIYINKAVEPSYPAGWVKIGTGTFTPSVLNMICCEWVGGTRVNYWITKA